MGRRRRADGTLRPTYRRQRAKRNRAKRLAWLAQFEPGARDRFFKHVDLDHAVFLRTFERETGLPRAEAAELLERTATARRWRKLRTRDRTVVGIAPPRGFDSDASIGVLDASSCGHDGWQDGCPECEQQEQADVERIGA